MIRPASSCPRASCRTPPPLEEGLPSGSVALPIAPPVHAAHREAPRGKALAKLALGALGVVYGDIGTSPLYAVRECFGGTHGVHPTPQNVLGIVSLVFWAMTFVVTFKYLAFVMRADNRGEGGILALMALVGGVERSRRFGPALLVVGLFGTALLYGDGLNPFYLLAPGWALGAATIGLVLGFGSSSAVAAAYGIAVTGTMTITTLLFHRVARERWRWSRWKVWPLTALFLAVDVAFFSANAVKIEQGGWFPLAVAAIVFTLLSTWKKGRVLLAAQLRAAGLSLDLFLADLQRKHLIRVPGTAVFMTGNIGNIPAVLLHHLKHNKMLHERVLLVSVVGEEIPSVPEGERVAVRELGSGFFQVVARYGFMETPDVPAMLESIPARDIPGPKLHIRPMETTYYLGRETLLASGPARMARWRKRVFIVMSRNAQTASAFFGLPPNRVVEMGAQIQM